MDNFMRDLREAIRPASCCEQAANCTCEVLRHYSRNSIELSDRLRQPTSPGYARHLVHQQENDGFCVVAMVWGHGQGTAVHDHGGVWCVEGCVHGRLEITSYRMLEENEQNVRLVPEDRVEVGQGSVGCLIPPFEHHKIYNPFNETAITIHVYGKELDNCTRYLEEGGDLFRREKVPLSYTTRPAALSC